MINYRQIVQDYPVDMDMSGGLLLEYQERTPKLQIIVNQNGGFYKAKLNGEQITYSEVRNILKLDDKPSCMRFDSAVYDEQRNNRNYIISVSEIDVS